MSYYILGLKIVVEDHNFQMVCLYIEINFNNLIQMYSLINN